MPLILCPNDNGSMQTVNRSGVEFDMCPTCRGVWLDRGELEKLLELAGGDGAGYGGQAAQPPSNYGQRPQQYRDDDRYRHGDDRHRHKKRSSLFDMFD